MKEYQKIQAKMNKQLSASIECSESGTSIRLEGKAEDWKTVVKAGYMAAKSSYREVINDVTTPIDKSKNYAKPTIASKELDGQKVEVLIIGGGIIGTAIARELSRFSIKTLLVDKEYDVAVHTSSRNDGMVHPGFAAPLGSLKSYYNVKGNQMFEQVAAELGVLLQNTGSYILFANPMTNALYPALKLKADKAGIKDSGYVNVKQLRQRIPNLRSGIAWAYHFPSTKVASPYNMTVAYAENAVSNGVEVSLETVVQSIRTKHNQIDAVVTNKGTVYPKLVINAAGVCADLVAEMAGDRFYTIHPRKGEIVLLDRKTGKYLDTVIGKPDLSIRSSHSKGGGLVKTTEGNILIGPNSREVEVREDYSTDRHSMEAMLDKQLPLIPELKRSDVITYFAGTRAATYKEDFIIERSQRIPNLIHVAGIQSPGFASSPAISDKVKQLAVDYLATLGEVKPNPNFNPIRKAPPQLRELPALERAKLIRANPDYGTIICRCEEISKGEIIDALHSPLPVASIDAVKRRTRSGMGRCQSGFCLPHVMHIIEQEKQLTPTQVTKKGSASSVLIRSTKPTE